MKMEDEVIEAIASSLERLREGLEAKKTDEVPRKVWLAMSDIEYAAFMASMRLKEKPNISRRKGGAKIENDEVVPEVIRSAMTRLERLRQNAKNGDLESVYKEALRIHSDLLGILEYFEKKKKSERNESSAISF